MKQWTVSDISKTIPFKGNIIPVLEFQDNQGEWQAFDILVTPARIVFGGYCNVGFLESGYIEREEFESIDETLLELLADLKVYYNDGRQYVSRIVCNECM